MAGGVYVLVHNVSAAHDFLLSMKTELPRNVARELPPDLARPKFHTNHEVASQCLKLAKRLFETGSFAVLQHVTDQGDRIPAGFTLGQDGLNVPWTSLKLRSRDHHQEALAQSATPGKEGLCGVVTACYFPLISLLLPAWLNLCRDTEETESRIAGSGSQLTAPNSISAPVAVEVDHQCTHGETQKRRRVDPAPGINTSIQAGSMMSRSAPPAPRLVLILTSGAGTPRDDTADADGNSTAVAALLIELFVRAVFEDVDVVQASSGPGIFRFDRNNEFVEGVLRPAVDAERHEALCRFGEDWRSRLKVTLSLSAGAPARVAALNASLSSYRPTLLHAVELKQFWHSGKLSRADLECHDYSVVSSHPPSNAEELPIPLRWAVASMRDHHFQFMNVREGAYGASASGGLFNASMHTDASTAGASGASSGEINSILPAPEPNDMATFWMRKSRKPVLAVLLVRKRRVLGSTGSASSVTGIEGGPRAVLRLGWPAEGIECTRGERGGVVFEFDPSSEYFTYRGLNMEVSMPTGSLCSERAAIASALANDPSLLRSECVAIAVLSSTLLPNCAWQHHDSVTFGTPATALDTATRSSEGEVEVAKDTAMDTATRSSEGEVEVAKDTAMDGGTISKEVNSISQKALRVSSVASEEVLLADVSNAGDHLQSPPRLSVASRSRPKRSISSQSLSLVCDPPAAGALARLESDPSEDLGPVPGSRRVDPASNRKRRFSALMLQYGTVTGASGGISSNGSTPYSDQISRQAPDDSKPPPLSPYRQDSEAFGEAGHRPHAPPPRRPPVPVVTGVDSARLGLGCGPQGGDVLLNPLPPCGSCTEWLRKIAEVNPEFKVLTFPDTTARRVFIREIEPAQQPRSGIELGMCKLARCMVLLGVQLHRRTSIHSTGIQGL